MVNNIEDKKLLCVPQCPQCLGGKKNKIEIK